MSAKPYNVVVDLMDLYWDDPVAFSIDMLDFIPDKWQRQVMYDVCDSRRTSVRSGQGVGKTGMEAAIAIWFLCCRPNARVVCTAPTRQQLHDVLWSEIAKWLTTSKVKNLLEWTKTRVYMKGRGDQWFATARTATRPENMQGFHAEFMLFICDEASGIEDVIMEAVLGTLTGDNNRLLMCGNPTKSSGVFFDSHNRNRSHFKTHKVSSLDSKRTSKENIAMLRNKYHADSDVYRVRVLGEFPRKEADTFIALETVELASDNMTDLEKTDTADIGVDVARFGDDETVIAPRIKNIVYDLICFSKKDTMVTAGNAIHAAKQLMKKNPFLKKVRIKIDDTGVGGGVTDRCREIVEEENLPFEILGINNGSKANDPEFDNLSTEMWHHVRTILEDNMREFLHGIPSSIELPSDDRMISQLTTRKYKMTSKGKIQIEPKDAMKKRGLQSPDRADAVILCFYEPPFFLPITLTPTETTYDEIMHQSTGYMEEEEIQ